MKFPQTVTRVVRHRAPVTSPTAELSRLIENDRWIWEFPYKLSRWIVICLNMNRKVKNETYCVVLALLIFSACLNKGTKKPTKLDRMCMRPYHVGKSVCECISISLNWKRGNSQICTYCHDRREICWFVRHSKNLSAGLSALAVNLGAHCKNIERTDVGGLTSCN